MKEYNKLSDQLKELLTEEEISETYFKNTKETAGTENVATVDQEKRLALEALQIEAEKKRLEMAVATLNAKIQQYLETGLFLEAFSFAAILEEYISILRRKKRQFADEIDLHYTKLSRLLNDREAPNLALYYRLETHSGGQIKATDWWKLQLRQQENAILQNEAARLNEAAKVKNALRPPSN